MVCLVGNFVSMPVQAHEDKTGRSGKLSKGCRSLITGTYLSQIRDGSGNFASRSVMTFHDDGTLAIVDSAQGPKNFSSLSGAYECVGKTEIRAVALDFGYQGNGELVRTDWTFKINKRSRILEGKVTLIKFYGLEDVDPFGDEGIIIDTFTFKSVPISASVPASIE